MSFLDSLLGAPRPKPALSPLESRVQAELASLNAGVMSPNTSLHVQGSGTFLIVDFDTASLATRPLVLPGRRYGLTVSRAASGKVVLGTPHADAAAVLTRDAGAGRVGLLYSFDGGIAQPMLPGQSVKGAFDTVTVSLNPAAPTYVTPVAVRLVMALNQETVFDDGQSLTTSVSAIRTDLVSAAASTPPTLDNDGVPVDGMQKCGCSLAMSGLAAFTGTLRLWVMEPYAGTWAETGISEAIVPTSSSDWYVSKSYDVPLPNGRIYWEPFNVGPVAHALQLIHRAWTT